MDVGGPDVSRCKSALTSVLGFSNNDCVRPAQRMGNLGGKQQEIPWAFRGGGAGF